MHGTTPCLDHSTSCMAFWAPFCENDILRATCEAALVGTAAVAVEAAQLQEPAGGGALAALTEEEEEDSGTCVRALQTGLNISPSFV